MFVPCIAQSVFERGLVAHLAPTREATSQFLKPVADDTKDEVDQPCRPGFQHVAYANTPCSLTLKSAGSERLLGRAVESRHLRECVVCIRPTPHQV